MGNEQIGSRSQELINLTEEYAAHNYAPLPVVLSEGLGAWVTDVEGQRYLDMLSAYSALNFGHRNPRFVEAAKRQLDRLTMTSRAFFSEEFALFSKELAEFCKMEMVLVMNSGAEAVETALKAARRWGYEKKKVEPDHAEIICFNDNFAGRTITIVSFNTEEGNRSGFGPFTPGFKTVSYGDVTELKAAINKNTVGILFEPIQGEGGILIPPYGFLKTIRDLCDEHNILMIADEIQTGLCRTGKIFCCDHEGVQPDLMILGKSLGGGIFPVSAVIGSREVLSVFTPGSHGSTFGGNPLACHIARDVLRYIIEEKPEDRAMYLGQKMLKALCSIADIPNSENSCSDKGQKIKSKYIRGIRGRGLLIGVDIDPAFGSAKNFCKKLMHEGILSKDTRSQTIRFAPPITIEESDLDWAIEKVCKVFLS